LIKNVVWLPDQPQSPYRKMGGLLNPFTDHNTVLCSKILNEKYACFNSSM